MKLHKFKRNKSYPSYPYVAYTVTCYIPCIYVYSYLVYKLEVDPVNFKIKYFFPKPKYNTFNNNFKSNK